MSDAHGHAAAEGHAAAGATHAAAHAAHSSHKKHEHDPPPGTPPWLISFGDMMTLFLCFFIMLVTMANRQDAGLIAGGLGPFVAALESNGMDLPLEGGAQLAAVNVYRQRFGLTPLTDPEQLLGAAEVASAADIERIVKTALRPHSELRQPQVAVFGPGSDELSEDARRYLDLLADTLRPGRSQILVLEGYAGDSGGDPALLAASRAQAVARHLLEQHGFIPQRVEARAFAVETSEGSASGRVDARLIQPAEKPAQ